MQHKKTQTLKIVIKGQLISTGLGLDMYTCVHTTLTSTITRQHLLSGLIVTIPAIGPKITSSRFNFCLSLHRHTYLCTPLRSRFIQYNKQQKSLIWSCRPGNDIVFVVSKNRHRVTNILLVWPVRTDTELPIFSADHVRRYTVNCCLLWWDKVRSKEKTYIWVEVRWKTKSKTEGPTLLVYTGCVLHRWEPCQQDNRAPQPCALLTGHFYIFFGGNFFLKKMFSYLSLSLSLYTHFRYFVVNVFYQHKVVIMTKTMCYIEVL
jgi:hypothetical protein